MANDPIAETYSDAKTKARAEAELKRMLATPHKPHKRVDKQSRGESKAPAAPNH